MEIPMSRPDLTSAEIEAVQSVLRTPYLSIGPQMIEFERGIAAFTGVRHAVGVSSGTAGLHLCVVAAGIGERDMVITTPFSFVASANVLLYERAVPVFVDIDPDTLNLDPTSVAEAARDLCRSGSESSYWLPRSIQSEASGTRRLSAILPVHAFGQPAEMDQILHAAREHRLAVIEDACEAIGAEYKGRKAGMLGDAGVYAFYPNKQMTAGEGGMVITDRTDWDGLFRSLRNQGRDVFDTWLNHTRLGYNYRMDEMSAALGYAQLLRIEQLLSNRDQVATWYNDRLRNEEYLQIPYIAPTTTKMSWFVYVVRLAPGLSRVAVMAALEDRGIPSRPYFTPIHLQPFYREKFGYREGDFPITENIARCTLALPFFGTMTEEQVDFVCKNLITILRREGVRV